MVVAGLGGSDGTVVARLGAELAERGKESVQECLAQVANGRVRERAREPTKHDGPVVGVFRAKVRPLAILALVRGSSAPMNSSTASARSIRLTAATVDK